MKFNYAICTIVIASIISSLVACKKTTHETVHENLIVTNVQAPPSGAVSTLLISTYINKLYVDLIGREPTTTELDAAIATLKSANAAVSARKTVVNQLLQSKAFTDQLFIRTSSSMLNATSKLDIYNQIQFDLYLHTFYMNSGDLLNANAVLMEKDYLDKLYASDSLYHLNQLSINDFYARFILNYFYDQVNMGTENFVKASFENLFHRAPSTSELAQSEQMVDGFVPGILFGETGNSKTDFVQIVTNSTSFYEGLVTTAYLNYLLRKPSDAEMNSQMTQLSNGTRTYNSLIESLVISTEYAGF